MLNSQLPTRPKIVLGESTKSVQIIEMLPVRYSNPSRFFDKKMTI